MKVRRPEKRNISRTDAYEERCIIPAQSSKETLRSVCAQGSAVLSDIMFANGDEQNLNLPKFAHLLCIFFSLGFLTLQ